MHGIDSGPMNLGVSVVCPVLVGRDDLLLIADARLESARAGIGGILFLAGEAGVGKTRFLGSIERRAAASGMRHVRAGTYPGDLEVAGAVLLDLARAMLRQPALREAGEAIEARLTSEPAELMDGDAHRRRRILALDLAGMIASLAEDGPIVIALEDLHQADDLTFEILGALALRAREARLLIIGSYRSDELYPRLPVREWRAHLLTKRLAEEVRLGRMDLHGTATMSALILRTHGPVPASFVQMIHQRTDGIPLHVEELLGMLTADGKTLDGAIPDYALAGGDVPDTLDSVIVDRFALRTPAARRVAAVGAVIGRSFGLDLLAAALDTDADELARPLAELASHFVLSESATSGRYGFRHALICDAIYGQIPAAQRRRLHGKVAEKAAAQGAFSDAFLSSHFERAGRSIETYESALRAARAAARISSHREAFQLYARVLRNAPTDLPSIERATIEQAYGNAAASCDDNVMAADALGAAHESWLRAGRPVEAAATVPATVAARHLIGDPLDARTDRLQAALKVLEAAPVDRLRDQARGQVLAGLAASFMLDRRLEESLGFGQSALDLALTSGDAATELNAMVTVGTCLVFAGRAADGWGRLETAIARSSTGHLEAEAARGYRMIGSTASAVGDYGRAEEWLREGIDYAERVELWNHRHYMASHLAHVLWATGRWDAAIEVAEHALADGRGGITTRITALLALGYVAMGRGDAERAREFLSEALAAGDQMRELQRLSPALWGLAELDLTTDNHPGAIEKCERARSASVAVGDVAYLLPFLVTGTRAYLAARDPSGAAAWFDSVAEALAARQLPGTSAAISHARGLIALATGSTGQARAELSSAVAGWGELGRAWERTGALIDVADCELRTNRVAAAAQWAADARKTADRLDARPLGARADAVLARARALHPTDAAWAPLTAREYEVARLIAEGGTNVTIADDLGISRRTVSAHVEHILAKLGAERRSEIAAWATTIASGG